MLGAAGFGEVGLGDLVVGGVEADAEAFGFSDLYDLTVKSHGWAQVIHTTANHLLWDPYLDKWISASKLSKNEHLKTSDGATVTVIGGTTPKVHDGWMCDLTVPGNNDHDFYVIPSGGYDVTGDVPVLVHSSPPGACSLTSAPDAPVINSKTVFTAKDGSFRIDLENQNPGEPGAGIHIQFMGRGADPAKYYYNSANGSWMTENGDALSSRIANQIPQSAINKAYQYLGLQVP